MRKSKVKDIEHSESGVFDYKVTQLGAKEGRKLFFRLAKMLTPAFGQLLKGTNSLPNGDLGSLPLDFVGESLKQLSQDANEELFDEVCVKMAHVTEFGSQSQDKFQRLDAHFDDHFAGEYAALFQWLAFALEVNFSSFFVEFKKRLKEAAAKRKAGPKNYQSGSTGQSIESPAPEDTQTP